MEDPTQNLHDITNEYYYQIGFLNGTSAHLVATTELNIWPQFIDNVDPFEEIKNLNHLPKKIKYLIQVGLSLWSAIKKLQVGKKKHENFVLHSLF